MPYHVDDSHPDCSGSAVVNSDTGAVVPGGCHPNHDMAVKHMQALYANVPDASPDQGKMMTAKTAHPAAQTFLRTFQLEDIRILTRAQGNEYADGRTVEAYAAVFDQEAEIQDFQGHYVETIDRSAFNKFLRDKQPQGNRSTWGIPVIFNHGMTIHSTPSDRGSVPIGAALDIRADERGLLTVSRYGNTVLADEVLDGIQSGSIVSQSFSGRIIRSDPNPGRRGYQPSSTGTLPKVRRTELGLREYGPATFAAYPGASIVGVRSALMQLLSTTQEDLDNHIVVNMPPGVDGEDVVEALRSYEAEPEPEDGDTSPDEEAVPDEPPAAAEHSSRASDPHDELLRKISLARTTRPGLARQEGS